MNSTCCLPNNIHTELQIPIGFYAGVMENEGCFRVPYKYVTPDLIYISKRHQQSTFLFSAWMWMVNSQGDTYKNLTNNPQEIRM